MMGMVEDRKDGSVGRESGYVLESRVCGRDLVGWESKKYKCSQLYMLGRSERRAARSAHVPH